MTFTWVNLLIIAAIVATILLVVGKLWNVLKRFIQLWLIIVLVLVGVKLVTDAGWV